MICERLQLSNDCILKVSAAVITLLVLIEWGRERGWELPCRYHRVLRWAEYGKVLKFIIHI